jgi:spore coat polysaccharide biosynthesis protein SpsF
MAGGGALKVVAIVQARMGSSRLPGKVLKNLDGETVLSRVIRRVQRAKLIDEVLVATTDQAPDDAIVEECEHCSVPVFRGNEDDVLDRYFRAGQLNKADVVVRVTSDCPLIDPEIAEETIRAFLNQEADYASNALRRTYPRGLDTEVMTLQALGRAWSAADQPYQRAHVTPYIYEHPDEFKIVTVTGLSDLSGHRWTLDTPEDLEFVRSVYARLRGREFRWRDVLELLEREPDLIELNRYVAQKPLHQG